MANLQEIADRAKNSADNPKDSEEVTATTPVMDDDDDEAVVVTDVVAPTPAKPSRKSKKTPSATNPIDISDVVSPDKTVNSDMVITAEDLRTIMPDMDDESFKAASQDIIQNVTEYKKNVMIQHGFTIEEATTAAKNRAEFLAKDRNAKYLEDNPKLGVVTIDKTHEEETLSQLTEDDKAKLHKVKGIKLIVVEDQELSALKIKNVPRNEKTSFLRTLTGSISHYSTPLPLLGDYVTFDGAQIIQLMSVVANEDDTLADTTSKRASLVYDRLSFGTRTQKYGPDNNVIMSYNDFTSNFKFHDLDLAMFAIVVASSTESTETELTCPACNRSFKWSYNVKTLLKDDQIPDNFKGIINDILGNRNNKEYLEDVAAHFSHVTRYKSPYTGNIYDIGYPSVAKALGVFGVLDESDNIMTYHSAMCLFVENMYIYDKSEDSYLEITSEEPALMLRTFANLPQEDISLIVSQVQPMVYTPKFILESKCPHCGNKMTNDLRIDSLIFLRAQDSSAEIM